MVDQMQAEAEQWSQVQSVLRDVHEEMESLHEARIAWEARAIRAESRLSSLKDSVRRPLKHVTNLSGILMNLCS